MDWQFAGIMLYGWGMAGLGGAIVWRMRAEVLDALRDEVAELRKQERIAQDRLLSAWTEGTKIPPRPVEPQEVQPLPAELVASIMEWESPDTRRQLEREYRELYFDRQWKVPDILKRQENVHP